MVVAETLAGIALVKSATEAIKGAIGTAQDVTSLAKDIDRLFEGEKQIQADRRKAHDPLSMKSVAEETINYKLAQEQMDDMRQLIDHRFGFGTWQGIVAERARRIQEAKELAKQEARRKQKKQDEIVEATLIFFGILIGLAVLVSAIIFTLRATDG
ncbi:MAG: hypothetical protein CMB16_00395 [Euryarchaeota archaeon]|jgi:hypothetical protein|nr:hypothetical protein [Euryarchaeota archaeon]|tara:strand:+ start:5075 stop:5542 length:468 start_codon:yes stop_codon:yes gene_type:complete